MGEALQYAWHTRILHQSHIITRIDQNFDRTQFMIDLVFDDGSPCYQSTGKYEASQS